MINRGPAPRVFISYAHEPEIKGHRVRALELAQSLRVRGLDAIIDQFVENDPPVWPRWTLDQIKSADFVVCLASPTYKQRVEDSGEQEIGLGARWEGAVITEELYQRVPRSHFITVILERCSSTDIPDILLPLGSTFYVWPQDDEDLYRRLTRQPRVVPAPLGEIVKLEVRTVF